MTREEIDRHVAGIQALRKRKRRRVAVKAWEQGFGSGYDYNPRRRHALRSQGTGDYEQAPVDQVFSARGRTGWLPRGGDE